MAKMVVGLKLEISMVTIQLPDPFDSDNDTGSLSGSSSSEDESSEDEDPDKKALNRQRKAPLKIDLDIYSSAYANARRYYDSRKIAVTKQEKTLAIAENMLKNTEKKIMVELKSATKSVHTGIVKMRKPFWFEKFLWFISSENYLVIGGRDASQNEVCCEYYNI
jgi:predicted ribosome quality control (RQC) complex YloA/Tae2 family protein